MTPSPAYKSPTSPLFIAAAIALIVFSGAGIAAIMGWIPTSMGNQSVSAPPHVSSAPSGHNSAHNSPPQYSGTQVAQSGCGNCGVVESIREVKVQGHASGVGLVGGALVGGLLGHQVGGGHGKDAMTVVGAAGGAYAGNEIEKNQKSGVSFQVAVRLDDSTTHTVSYASLPQWREGDRVRYDNGRLESIR